MEVLKVDRPEKQQNWHFDGVSVMPILRGETPAVRGIGWMFNKAVKNEHDGYAFRYGKWKYVAGGISCNPASATFDCSKEQLYDMDVDWAENHDLAAQHPDILAAIAVNFTVWYNTIQESITNESKCRDHPTPGPSPTPKPVPFPKHVVPSSNCTFTPGTALTGKSIASGSVHSREACCGACEQTKGCAASDYVEASAMRPTWQGITTGGTCHLHWQYRPKAHISGEIQTACKPPT
jgi:hypothetical protein